MNQSRIKEITELPKDKKFDYKGDWFEAKRINPFNGRREKKYWRILVDRKGTIYRLTKRGRAI